MAGAVEIPMIVYLMGGGAMLFVLLVGGAVMSFSGGEQVKSRRLGTVTKRAKVDEVKKKESGIKVIDDGRNAKGLDKVIRKLLPNPNLLRQRLMQAGLETTLNQYFIVCLGVGVFITLLNYKVSGLSLVPSMLFGVGGGLGLPSVILKWLIGRRREKFLGKLPEAMDLMVRGLRSGLPVSETIKTVGAEIEKPIGTEFSRVVDDLQLGRTMEESLWRCADRIGVTEFRFFVVCISVQRETGGNLGETLANLSEILRKRRAAKLKIKALSSEARFSAYLIGSLPFVMGGILYTLNPGYISKLFIDPTGITMLSVGGTWLTIGFATMAKMVRFEI
ncbi:MAG: type II secretion system F family protein [Inquilinus sp.]|nr:type II secretion system F family protein [Inquilinus sp.]